MPACKRVLSHPPTTHHALHCFTVPPLPLGYSLTCTRALISPLTHQMWGCPSSCYRVQFNIPLNCSALSTKCEGTGKSSPGVHSSSPLFFSTAAKQSHAQEKGGNSRCREECVKASVSIFSKDFSFECLVPLVQLCWAASKKGRNSHQRMCQSLGIPMPKFSISTVSISHGSSLKE